VYARCLEPCSNFVPKLKWHILKQNIKSTNHYNDGVRSFLPAGLPESATGCPGDHNYKSDSSRIGHLGQPRRRSRKTSGRNGFGCEESYRRRPANLPSAEIAGAAGMGRSDVARGPA
jgi:hypothetical protein